MGKREGTQRSEFCWCLSLLLSWWKLLAAALHEATLLENNFLLYSNLVEITPLRNEIIYLKRSWEICYSTFSLHHRLCHHGAHVTKWVLLLILVLQRQPVLWQRLVCLPSLDDSGYDGKSQLFLLLYTGFFLVREF